MAIILIIVLLLAFRFLIVHQRHKEIMTALEKGLPPSEIKILRTSKYDGLSPNWITKITLGVFFMIAAGGLVIFSWLISNHWENLDPNRDHGPFVCLFACILSFALGSTAIVSGLLSRKGEEQVKQIELSASQPKLPPS
jgi:hypothetical protein